VALLWAFALPDVIGTFPGLYYYYAKLAARADRSLPSFTSSTISGTAS
jgi:hypothetical protein